MTAMNCFILDTITNEGFHELLPACTDSADGPIARSQLLLRCSPHPESWTPVQAVFQVVMLDWWRR